MILALLLVIGLLPVMALAEETQDPPPVPAALKVTTGNNTTPVVWAPAMTAGMTPAYAKTSAEGLLVLEGASETDYNLKAEWPADGKPTLTLKDATLANNCYYIEKASSPTGVAIDCPETIDISGTEDFVIIVKGTNNIMARHDTKPTTTAAYRSPTGIFAKNEGTLTITGDSQADSLIINNYSGSIMAKWYNALTIENITFKGQLNNTGSNGQFGISLSYGTEENADKTNFTVRNADFSLDGARYHGNILIMLCAEKENTYSASNTGDILFQNSKINVNRNNETSSSQDGTTIIRYGKDSTFTIDRCDLYIYSRYRTMAYWPATKNVTLVSAGDIALAPGTIINSSALGKLQTTHVCGTDTDDGDCTTAPTCAMCGKTLGAAQTAHTPAADDGDCTTAITCANEGCKVVVTEAKAAHTPAADDGDCTTAIKCTDCGTETTAAKPSHTSPADRTDCSQASACAVCNKALAAGEHTGGAATCKDKAKCELCQEPYGELGKHTGGTATCKEQAKCEVCQEPYGELSTTHVPAEDDGNCTTAVKCTLCEAEVVAAKTHAYTDAKDTDCDNAGCNHTRTPNPETGDMDIMLFVAILLGAAVGFCSVGALRKKEF